MSPKRTKQSLLFIAFVLMYQFAQGQLVEQPLQQSNHPITKDKSTARTQSYPPRSLPFWDDFTFQNDSLWVDFGAATISDGIGILPPTMNVASFNGLKADGTPYDPNDNLATGYTDVLTSQLIKMTEVPAGERGTVYFSFFYQWRGNGEAPDPGDYLAVEFFDGTNWIEVDRLEAEGSINQSVFYPKILPVAAAYFHDAFQFRFRSHGRISGPYDVWNIDYIFLAKDRNATDISFPDQAITSKLSPLFGSYTAMPKKHFFTTKPLEAPSFGIYNLRNDPDRDDNGEPLSYLISGVFTNYVDSIPTIYSNQLSVDTLDINPIIPPFTHIQETIKAFPNPDDPLQFNPNADSIFITLKTRLITGDVDSLGFPARDYPDRYIGADFRANDTINTRYVLKDYYAYDDGIAEHSVYLANEGNRLAYQFDMLTDEVDTLIGFLAYFPFYGGPQSILDVFVMSDDNGLPGSVIASKENVLVQKNGENKFMWIEMQATLVSGKFYIGWVAPPTKTHLGLDKNNNSGDKIFENVNGFWLQNTAVTGSLMIRPVFGDEDVVTGIENQNESVTLYPNPNNGGFHFDARSRILAIHDLTGREIIFKVEVRDEDQFVSLRNPTPGMYIVRSIRNGKMSSQKIVVY